MSKVVAVMVAPAVALLGVDGGLVDQHDRDVVLDRIDPAALVAFEALAVVDEPDGGLAVGTREDFEQFLVNWHTVSGLIRSNYNILG
jgi:hypothetical protein